MSGLLTSLSMAARAMDAQRAGLAVTGENIANLNTDGYVRRNIQLAEGRPAGVDVVGIRAQRDRLLEARVRQEMPSAAREGAIADSLTVVEASLGEAGASLDAQLSAFFDSFAALTQDPASTVARDGVVLQGRLLTRSFNDLATRLDDARRGTDVSVRAGVESVNRLASQVASLNTAINAANGGGTEALKDEQLLALTELAKLADITVIARSDGGVDVSLGQGRAIVMGANTYALQAVDTPPNGFASIELGGLDVTGEFNNGQLSGLLSVRDVMVPGYQARLDAIAFSVAQQVNTAHQAGTDLLGGTGNNFFAPIGGPAGAAAAIELDAAVSADPQLIAASLTGAPGDNQTAKAIAALRDARVVGGTASFAESWSQLVYRVGSDAQTATSQQKGRQEVVDQVARLLDQVSGVSLDEEASSMLRFQRAYEANARYFSTVDQVLATLLRLVGG
ncbi:MAG TPA: flagellar hook-associated protein FlgK [Vicinamibacterales bacterium]|nr:flagellar hook-associated protein FlgK [Vicinamibacterales bacterium]